MWKTERANCLNIDNMHSCEHSEMRASNLIERVNFQFALLVNAKVATAKVITKLEIMSL